MKARIKLTFISYSFILPELFFLGPFSEVSVDSGNEEMEKNVLGAEHENSNSSEALVTEEITRTREIFQVLFMEL